MLKSFHYDMVFDEYISVASPRRYYVIVKIHAQWV